MNITNTFGNGSALNKNYEDIYNYILSRVEGSSQFDRNNFYRLEYFWRNPVVAGEEIERAHFLSEGDIAVLNYIYR